MIKTYFFGEENLKGSKKREKHNIGKVVIGYYRFEKEL